MKCLLTAITFSAFNMIFYFFQFIHQFFSSLCESSKGFSKAAIFEWLGKSQYPMSLVLPGNRDLLYGHVLLCLLTGAWYIDVGVIIYLVALAQVLDDVKVITRSVCNAVLQKPAIRLRVRVPTPQHILHGCLKITHSCQHRHLGEGRKDSRKCGGYK